ncbi:type II secretion system protein [Nitrospirota bacterium]
MTLPRAKEGFTLLEVMVAIAIIAGLMVTLLGTLNHHLDVASSQETITTAVLLGRQKLHDAQRESLVEKGNFESPYEDYAYAVTLTETMYPGVFELAVEVRKDNELVLLKELLRNEAMGR